MKEKIIFNIVVGNYFPWYLLTHPYIESPVQYLGILFFMTDVSLIEKLNQGYCISSSKSKLDLEFIYQFLAKESYWAAHIPYSLFSKSIDGSICFGIYESESVKQVAFARVITDGATYGYLCDVFVTGPHQGKGLGTWLIKEILDHPDLQGFRSWMLATRDAHELYRRHGFTSLENPERFMRMALMQSYPPE